MVLTNSDRVPRVPPYLGVRFRKSDAFHLKDCHLLWFDFPDDSVIHRFGNFPADPKLRPNRSRDPLYATLSGLTRKGFGLFPVRSPLLRKSLLFSLPEVTKMFQFTSLASNTYVFSEGSAGIILRGFPHSEISGSKFV